MADSASKRRRLSWISPSRSSPGGALQILPSTQHEQQDIIEFFAQRGEQKKGLEAQVQSLEANLQHLQASLSKAETIVAHQKVSLTSSDATKQILQKLNCWLQRLHIAWNRQLKVWPMDAG